MSIILYWSLNFVFEWSFNILVKLDEDLIKLGADYQLQLLISDSNFPIKNIVEEEKNMSA